MEFKICVTTGNRKFAGTDANVWIRLHDDAGKQSQDIKLDKWFRDDFERSSIDVFVVGIKSPFNHVNTIELWRDSAWLLDDWFLDNIHVENLATNETSVFEIHQWIKAHICYKFLEVKKEKQEVKEDTKDEEKTKEKEKPSEKTNTETEDKTIEHDEKKDDPEKKEEEEREVKKDDPEEKIEDPDKKDKSDGNIEETEDKKEKTKKESKEEAERPKEDPEEEKTEETDDKKEKTKKESKEEAERPKEDPEEEKTEETDDKKEKKESKEEAERPKEDPEEEKTEETDDKKEKKESKEEAERPKEDTEEEKTEETDDKKEKTEKERKEEVEGPKEHPDEEKSEENKNETEEINEEPLDKEDDNKIEKPDVNADKVSIEKESLKVPFSLPIAGGIFDRQTICIKGKSPDKDKRFEVRLQNSCRPGDASGCLSSLCLGVRLDEDVVARNSYSIDGEGNEERDGVSPFKENEKFELLIKVMSDRYEIFVDGALFALFNHRLEKEVGSILCISGDVDIRDVQFYVTETEYSLHPPFNNLAVPFKQTIGNLTPGRVIRVSGAPHAEPNRFTINFLCGETVEDGIAFHLNVRFEEDSSRVVCNSYKKDESWGVEEMAKEFPFVPGQLFHLTVQTTSKGFMVTVDNNPLVEFEYREHLDQVSTLDIHGDVDLQLVIV